MAWIVYDNYTLKQNDGNAVDWNNDTIKLMLIDDTRAPVQATDSNMTATAANEVSGTEYTAGGKLLGTSLASLSAGTVKLDGADQVYDQSAGGFTNARYVVAYKFITDYASSIPIAYADLGGDKGNVSGDLTLAMASTGIIAITNS